MNMVTMISRPFYFCKGLRGFGRFLWTAVKIKGNMIRGGKIYPVIRWFCGIWAFGLGFRMSLEMIVGYLRHSSYIHIPIYYPLVLINLGFDFLPLLILGLSVVIIETIYLSTKVGDRGCRVRLPEKVGSNFNEELMKKATQYLTLYEDIKLREKIGNNGIWGETYGKRK